MTSFAFYLLSSKLLTDSRIPAAAAASAAADRITSDAVDSLFQIVCNHLRILLYILPRFTELVGFSSTDSEYRSMTISPL